MASLIGSLLHRTKRDNSKPLNYLSFPTHEAAQSQQAKTKDNIYLWRGPNVKDWNKGFRIVPKNVHLLPFNDTPTPEASIPADVNFDVIVCQNKWGQYPVAKRLSQLWHVPLVCIEHTLPPNPDPNYLAQMKSMRGDLNLFISDYSAKAWGWKPGEYEVLHHGMDTELFKPDKKIVREAHVLSVVNDWANRDWCCNFSGWQRIVQGDGNVLPVKVLGDTPGLSQAAESVEELVIAYQTAQVFLNTSTISPVPTALMEAMAAGCAIVSTATCMIPEIITHGKDGFISNNERDLRGYCDLLLRDKNLARQMGNAARQTIISRFGEAQYVNRLSWLLRKAADTVYTGENQ